MGFRDLIPWTKGQQLATGREAFDPFLTLHRDMNRLFDDVFRGFGPLGRIGTPLMEGQFAWPRIELSETDKVVTISAELPGLSERDVQVEIANGVLSIRGQKKAERSDEFEICQRALLRIVRAPDSAGRRRGRQGQGGLQEWCPDRDASEVRAVEPERQTYHDQHQLKPQGGGVTVAAVFPNSYQLVSRRKE